MIIYEDEELIIPNGIGYSITDADIVNNDEISVFINQNGVKVLKPTEGYTGFSRVTIETDIHPLTQSKSIDSSTAVQHVEPDNGYEALDEVVCYLLDLCKVRLKCTVEPSKDYIRNHAVSKRI